MADYTLWVFDECGNTLFKVSDFYAIDRPRRNEQVEFIGGNPEEKEKWTGVFEAFGEGTETSYVDGKIVRKDLVLVMRIPSERTFTAPWLTVRLNNGRGPKNGE